MCSIGIAEKYFLMGRPPISYNILSINIGSAPLSVALESKNATAGSAAALITANSRHNPNDETIWCAAGGDPAKRWRMHHRAPLAKHPRAPDAQCRRLCGAA